MVQLKVLRGRTNLQSVPFGDHQEFPDCQTRANYVGLTADNRIPKLNCRKFGVSQSLFDQNEPFFVINRPPLFNSLELL